MQKSILTLIFVLLCITNLALAAENRYALVIGNAAYPSARLENPVNDATDMTAKLKQRGFTVTRLVDANQQRMEQAIKSFTNKLTGTNSVGIFYYAGHGLEVEGENYIVPVDAELSDEEDVKYKTVNMGQVLDRMNKAGNGLNLVILDACRNNPFKRSWKRGLSRVSGLAQMQPAAGTLILYATEPHKEAQDGQGERNGTFTKYLLAALDMPGVQVEEVFKQVSEQVTAETRRQQIPWFEGVIHGRFYFVAPPVEPIKRREEPTQAFESVEQTYWQSTEKCGTAKCFKSYLRKYPRGEFVELAEAQLGDLAPVAKKKPVPPPVAPQPKKPVKVTVVRPVTLIAGRYQDNGDGTVTDVTTNLMWKRCAEGNNWTGSTCDGSNREITWNAAMPSGQQKSWDSFAGYSDWRMPTIENLRTLVYCSSGKPKFWNDTGNFCEGHYKSPTINTTAFPNVAESALFWSASAPLFLSDSAYELDLRSGYAQNVFNFRSFARSVRLVRGRQ